MILNSIEELNAVPGPVFLAIGVFDGLHLGHKAVIARAIEDAKRAGGTAVVVTFDPHPARVLRPDKAPRLLASAEHKRQLMQKLGVTRLLVVEFDRALAELPPEEFIRKLHGACRPLREICVGHEWCFGRNRAGNLELLKALGAQLGFEEVGVPAVEVDGEIVSSTLIRAAVQAGDLAKAAKLLGHEYTILGRVIEGQHIGGAIGFPTANLAADNEQFPPNGVYAVRALHRGAMLNGVVNIGVRPTVAAAQHERLLEVHLFDFDQRIYGEEIEVVFKSFLRGEQKFASIDDLKAQIARDAGKARSLLEAKP